MKINRLFSWKDVERIVMSNENKWSNFANRIVVYRNTIDVSLISEGCRSDMIRIFSEMFDGNFDEENNYIALEWEGDTLQIDFSGEEEKKRKSKIPLFYKVLYENSAYGDIENTSFLSPQVIAFHSYKGGVGRTLSLLAFAKAWVAQQPKKKKKLLIVDSDIEAPGLTWLQNEESEQHYSYLDLLEAIQNRKFDIYIDDIVKQIEKSTLQVTTEKEITEQYFIPVYRYKEQLFDIYSKPENIVTNVKWEYIIPEVLSKLGEKLGVNAILIDLRAGLSEYSSPFLFDLRVKKYFVTSTSSQSVHGLNMILEQVTKGHSFKDDELAPKVFLTMVQDTLDSDEKMDIINEIDNYFWDENDSSSDSSVIELRFSDVLVHLSSLEQIMKVLGTTQFYRTIEQQVIDNYISDKRKDHKKISHRDIVIDKIHNFAENQISAEANVDINILVTQAISNLKKKYRNEIPCTVILGAKGSGKTFLYRQMLKHKTWQKFCASLEKETSDENAMFFVPVLAAANAKEIHDLLKACISNVNKETGIFNISESVWFDNQSKLDAYIENNHSSQEWKEFWEKFLVESIDSELSGFNALNAKLNKYNKKIVFLIDGLEEILQKTISNESQQIAVSILCQDVINILDLKYKNIGAIVFLRKDLARDAIKVNFEQFNQLYGSVELRWTWNEALRLALWLVYQAYNDFYQEDIPIETATPELIEKQLQRLWGLKLGKASSNEAYSSRWILAALSDFHGQLQARDIIRFLWCATEIHGKKIYDDRYIMPAEIKNAVPKCSEAKIKEIKQEIGYLKPILEKFERADSQKKILPFSTQTFELTNEEEKIMIQEGYLIIDDGKYYLPEIIRHSLQFRYGKGARPKVLSLINKGASISTIKV